jgi:uncharacterized protein YecT (DUF1311 family)
MSHFIKSAMVFLAASLALAQPSDQTKKSKANVHSACDDAQTQAEMNVCSGREYAKADAHLNAIYHKILDPMKSDLAEAEKLKHEEDAKPLRESIEKLTSAERAWVRYRDLLCGLAADGYEGGSIQPLIRSECLTDATEHHIQELKNAFEVGERKLE